MSVEQRHLDAAREWLKAAAESTDVRNSRQRIGAESLAELLAETEAAARADAVIRLDKWRDSSSRVTAYRAGQERMRERLIQKFAHRGRPEDGPVEMYEHEAREAAEALDIESLPAGKDVTP